MSNEKTGIELIAEERKRHITKHGYDIGHDRLHAPGYDCEEPLVMAAIAYLQPNNKWDSGCKLRSKDFNPDEPEKWIPLAWPFEPDEWHGDNDSRLIQLIKAGSLIAAEIDRLQNLNQ